MLQFFQKFTLLAPAGAAEKKCIGRTSKYALDKLDEMATVNQNSLMPCAILQYLYLVVWRRMKSHFWQFSFTLESAKIWAMTPRIYLTPIGAINLAIECFWYVPSLLIMPRSLTWSIPATKRIDYTITGTKTIKRSACSTARRRWRIISPHVPLKFLSTVWYKYDIWHQTGRCGISDKENNSKKTYNKIAR